MSHQDLESAYAELAKLTSDLPSSTQNERNEGHRVLAATAQVVVQLGKIAQVTQSQIEEVMHRERARDRAPPSLRNERAIRFLAQLTQEDREQLVLAVERSSPSTSLQNFGNSIANTLKNSQVPNWRLQDLLESLGECYPFLATQGETEDAVNSAVAWLTEPYGADQSFAELMTAVDAPNPASIFSQQLKRLLRCHSTLGFTVKAQSLVRRNERQFASASVSTDVRPIFSSKVETAPSYGVIIHNLVLGTSNGTVGFALTSDDILALAGVLDRAYKKEQTLRKQAAYRLLPLVG